MHTDWPEPLSPRFGLYIFRRDFKPSAAREGCYHCVAAGVGCSVDPGPPWRYQLGEGVNGQSRTWIPWQKAAVAGSITDEGAGGVFPFLPAFSTQTACLTATHFGGLDQLVDRSLRMREVPGSKPGFSI